MSFDLRSVYEKEYLLYFLINVVEKKVITDIDIILEEDGIYWTAILETKDKTHYFRFIADDTVSFEKKIEIVEDLRSLSQNKSASDIEVTIMSQGRNNSLIDILLLQYGEEKSLKSEIKTLLNSELRTFIKKNVTIDCIKREDVRARNKTFFEDSGAVVLFKYTILDNYRKASIENQSYLSFGEYLRHPYTNGILNERTVKNLAESLSELFRHPNFKVIEKGNKMKIIHFSQHEYVEEVFRDILFYVSEDFDSPEMQKEIATRQIKNYEFLAEVKSDKENQGGEGYYYFDSALKVLKTKDTGHKIDKKRKEIGNYFKDIIEASKAVRNIKKGL